MPEEIKGTKAELRRFGITLGIVLALWGGLLLWRKKDFYFYFFIFSPFFFAVGLFLPQVLKPVHKTWMTLTRFLSRIITNTILIILFYIVVMPVGLIGRLFGKKFLALEFGENKDSYWIPKEAAKFDKSRYENQF